MQLRKAFVCSSLLVGNFFFCYLCRGMDENRVLYYRGEDNQIKQCMVSTIIMLPYRSCHSHQSAAAPEETKTILNQQTSVHQPPACIQQIGNTAKITPLRQDTSSEIKQFSSESTTSSLVTRPLKRINIEYERIQQQLQGLKKDKEELIQKLKTQATKSSENNRKSIEICIHGIDERLQTLSLKKLVLRAQMKSLESRLNNTPAIIAPITEHKAAIYSFVHEVLTQPAPDLSKFFGNEQQNS